MDGVSDHDKSGSADDHPYASRGPWWSLCAVCSLARAAHTTTHAEGGEHAHPDAS